MSSSNIEPEPTQSGSSTHPKTERPEEEHARMSERHLTTEILFGVSGMELETISLPDLFQRLQSSDSGLSHEEAWRRRGIFGANMLEYEQQSGTFEFVRQCLTFMWNPLAWIIEAAAILAITVPSTGWPVLVGISLRLLLHSVIGVYEERNTGAAVKAVVGSLAPKAKVRRGFWVEIDSWELVPGDLIAFNIGDVIPADCRLIEIVDLSVDEANITGETSRTKNASDHCYSGSVCLQGEAEAVVISTGANTFFARASSIIGQRNTATDRLQSLIAQVASFCLVAIGLFVVLELVILYPVFQYSYRRGLDAILVILIGGAPLAMPLCLSTSVAVGVQQLAKYSRGFATRLTAIQDLAGITILCTSKTGTLMTNKLTIDMNSIKTYASFSAEEVLRLAGYACRTMNQDAIDACIVYSISAGDVDVVRDGIELLEFKPFRTLDKCAQVTYRDETTGGVRRVIKGMPSGILELCSRNKIDDLVSKFEVDLEELATRGLRSLAVAYEEVDGGDTHAEGNGFELVGLLPFFDSPREDAMQAVSDAQALGVKVVIVTGDHVAVSKDCGRRIGLGDDMFPATVLRDGPPPGSPYTSFAELILNADGFAAVSEEDKPEIVKRYQHLGHSCAIASDSAHDIPALSQANVGIALEGSKDAIRAAAGIVFSYAPGLSRIVEAIRASRIIIQRMRNCSIYFCATTVRMVVSFSVLALVYHLDFPPFMVLMIVVFNSITNMMLSIDRILPPTTPTGFHLTEIFTSAMIYGLYLAVSTISLVVTIKEASFFQDSFSLVLESDKQLRMVIYLQVATISHALIFITRSHRKFFFLERRPYFTMLLGFALAQTISSVVAAYGNWSFAGVQSIPGRWIGAVWIWNIVWFIPLDWIKFAMDATIFDHDPRHHGSPTTETNIRTRFEFQSRLAAIHESLYANRVWFLQRATPPQGIKLDFGMGSNTQVSITPEERQRFGSMQVQKAAAALVLASQA